MFRSLKTLINSPGDLLINRVVHGAFWLGSLQISQRLLGLIRTIVLARILAPEDFGLFGIALIGLSTLEAFSATGIDTALIQKKDNTDTYLDTAWTIKILRGCAIALTLAILAPQIASFFGEAAAIPIIRALSVTILFRSFQNIGIVFFSKELRFNKSFVYNFIGTITDFIVSVTAAIILENVWAIVYGLLAKDFVLMVSSYFFHDYRPRIHFDISKAKYLYDYGKYIFLQSVVLFLLTQGDDIFVGKVLGASALGFYQMAYLFSNISATQISHVISKITFPAYSKMQDDLPRMRRALLKTLDATTLISLPIACGLFVMAHEFTQYVLGEKWLQIVPVLQLMCIFGAFRSIGSTMGPIFNALAKVNIAFNVSAVQLFIMALLIYPLTVYFGIFGTAIAITIAMFVSLLHICWSTAKTLSIKPFTFLNSFLTNIIASIAMASIIYTVKLLFGNTIFALIIPSLVGILIYSLFSFLMGKQKLFTFLAEGEN